MAREPRATRKPKAGAGANQTTAAETHNLQVTPEEREIRVRHRAFVIFEERIRNGIPGSADADWNQAEREVNARLATEAGIPKPDGNAGAKA